MTEALLGTIVVPIADKQDAAMTARALEPYVDGDDAVTVVNVVEKAGGAPDKASVEQREEYAEDLFSAFETAFQSGASLDSAVLYGTDVATAIHDHAREVDASAIVFTSRGLSGWTTFLTGNVREELIDAADRPLVVLPGEDD